MKLPITICDAITQIAPLAQFVIYNNDYSTIRWDSPLILQPTLDQVNATLQILLAAQGD